jgi:hypothetical protein
VSDHLDQLLEAARKAGPLDRIGYRDAIAQVGVDAIPALAEWLQDPALGAFAVRVLARLAQDPQARASVVQALLAARGQAATDGIGRDIWDALAVLGAGSDRRAGGGATGAPRVRREGPPAGRPGRPGRRYWAMRTSPTEPAFIWSEARRGQLRQGWGSTEEQDLRLIADRLANGLPLDRAQHDAKRALRMLDTEENGVRIDDLVVTQNLPRYGYLSVFRITGPYTFALPDSIEDYGHILPVELLVEDVPRGAAAVSVALRYAIALRPRLYEITPYGGDVEALVETVRG